MKTSPQLGDEAVDGRVVRARQLREARRTQILDATRRVLARRGFHQTAVRDILEEAGIARGTFYAHFDGKQAAFREILDRWVERVAAALRPVDLTSAMAARDQLLANLDRALALLEADEDLAVLLFRQAEGISEEVRADLDAFYDRVAALIERSLSTGAEIGIVRPGNIPLRARFLLGAVKEAARRSLDDAGASWTREELGREMVDFALFGVTR